MKRERKMERKRDRERERERERGRWQEIETSFKEGIDGDWRGGWRESAESVSQTNSHTHTHTHTHTEIYIYTHTYVNTVDDRTNMSFYDCCCHKVGKERSNPLLQIRSTLTKILVNYPGWIVSGIKSSIARSFTTSRRCSQLKMEE